MNQPSELYILQWKSIAYNHWITAVAIGFILVHVGFLVASQLYLDHFVVLTQEDGVFENVQAILYFSSSILLFSSLRNNIQSSLHRMWIVLLGLGLLFIAGEEISWGQRIFDFHVPAIEQHSVQGEFNLHNYPFLDISPSRVLSIISLAFGVLLPVALGLSRTLRVWILDRLQFLAPHPVVLFCFLSSYMWYSTFHSNSAFPTSIEESRETTIALGFFTFALAFRYENVSRSEV